MLPAARNLHSSTHTILDVHHQFPHLISSQVSTDRLVVLVKLIVEQVTAGVVGSFHTRLDAQALATHIMAADADGAMPFLEKQ